MTSIPYQTLTWLQNGEPVSGGDNGSSQGVLNRPLTQLLSNDLAIKDSADSVIEEVTEARGDYGSLNARLTDISTSKYLINSATQASIKARIPSCFDYTHFNEKRELTFTASDPRTNSTKYGFAVQPQTDETRTEDMADSIALVGNPKPVYVNGKLLYLDQSPDNIASILINLGEAPEEGTRLTYCFLEVWQEQFVFGSEYSVLFPNGAVNFQSSQETFDGCTLYTANLSGNEDSPIYLAEAELHGHYVKANDPNIVQFISNSHNNIFEDVDGHYYQIRWRVRTANVHNKDLIHAYQDTTNIKAQGQLASPSNIGFASVFDDEGLSMASASNLSKNGNVYAIPLALVHRRNQGEFSVTNMNGSDSYTVHDSGTLRPDNRFYDSIALEDMLDLRQHGMFDNNYNYQKMVDINFDRALKGTSSNVFGAWYADPDGNKTQYTDTGIYGTSLLRADCLYGGDEVPDSTWQVQTQLRSPNGVYTKLDGMRNYFGNMPSSQQIFGMIPAQNVPNMTPQTFWTYSNTDHTLSFNATAMKSGNNLDNTGVEGVTKVSNKVPSVRFGASMTTLGLNGMEVNGEWSGLGNDNATFTMKDESYFICVCRNASAQTLNVGDTYTSVNGVSCTLIGYNADALTTTAYGYICFKFSGSTLPVLGTLTGAADNTGTFASITLHTSQSRSIFVKASDISGIKVNDTYSTGGNTYKVKEIYPSTNILGLVSSSHNNSIAAGTFTKVSSASGPATFTVASNQLWFNLLGFINGASGSLSTTTLCSYALMPANCPIYCVASVDFTKGSSVLSDVPFKDNKSYLGCQYWVDGEQLLPNGGKGFVPVGLGDSTTLDSHTKCSSLESFMCGTDLFSINKSGSGSEIFNGFMSCVLKDDDEYAFFNGFRTCQEQEQSLGNNMYLIRSEDGIHTKSITKLFDYGTEPNGYDGLSVSEPAIIKDSSKYRMWYTGRGLDSKFRILYTESTDLVSWSTPQLAFDCVNPFTGVEMTGGINAFSVLKEDSTLKLITTSSVSKVILWTSSDDGTTWIATAEVSIPQGSNRVKVIKENNVYRAFYYEGNSYVISTAISTDLINWSDAIKLCDVIPDLTESTRFPQCCLLKEDSTYKLWQRIGNESDRAQTFLKVLTITDTNNVGTSTTGVYTTAPANLNIAPSDSSKVVLFYKSNVQPSDSALLTDESAIFEYEDIQKSSNAIATSLDPYTTTEPDHIYREAMNTIYPWVSLIESNAYGSGKSVGSNNVLMLHSNFNTDSTIIHQLPIFEATTGIQIEGKGDSQVVKKHTGESCNIFALQDSSLYNTASLSDSTYELASELIRVGNRVVMAVGSSYGNNGFDQSMALCRPLGNPILK